MKIPFAVSLCVFLVGLTSLAQAQIEFYRPSPFVVWMHHSDDYENTCILVRPDASYHLERSQDHRQVVYAGLLSPDELKALHAMLDDPGFAGISETDVKNALLTPVPAPFSVMVPREGKYQRLDFLDADSRKPFRKAVDPLLAWFERMKKDKRSIPSSEELKGCMPDPVSDSPQAPAQAVGANGAGSIKVGPGSGKAPARTPGFEFLVHLGVNSISNGAVKETCVGVFPSGGFRMEEATQHLLDSKRVQVYKGSLMQDQVRELRQLLDSPELLHTVHRNVPAGVAVYDGEQVRVAIPRDNYVQNLIYTDYFGASHHWSHKDVPGGSSQIDPEDTVVKPLREWIRNNVEKKKGKAIKEESANGCSSMTAGSD